MGRPNTKKKVKKLSRQEQELQAAKKAKFTKIFLTVFACIALVGVLAGVGVGIFAAVDAAKYNEFVTYESDMTPYVYISEDDYKNIKVEMQELYPDEADVEKAIRKLLYNNRKLYKTDDFNGDGEKDDAYNGDNIKDQTVKLGDTANIFYRGYYINDDGKRVYFDGGCNFASSTASEDKPHALGIGSGGFVDGFEVGLIGKNMKDYATLERFSAGETVKAGDFVYISYDCFFFDGTAKKGQYALVDLSDPDLDKTWGEGFDEYLMGALAGVTIKDPHLVDKYDENGGKETDTYSSVKIEKIIRVTETAERPILEVEVQFPLNYAEELAGKTGWFEVYIMTTQLYETPAFDEAFLTDTLKVKAEDLAEYEGDTLLEKYRAKVLADEIKAHEEVVKNASIEALWAHYLDKAEVKKYPMGDVKFQYDSMMAELEAFYSYYAQSYGFSSLKDAAQVYMDGYYGVDIFDYAKWEDAVYEQAELAVKRMLVLYYVMNREGFIPAEEEYNKAVEEEYNKTFETYLEEQGCIPSEYETTAEYEKAKAEAKTTFDSYYSEEYFGETVRYNYAIDKIVESFTDVVYPD